MHGVWEVEQLEVTIDGFFKKCIEEKDGMVTGDIALLLINSLISYGFVYLFESHFTHL